MRALSLGGVIGPVLFATVVFVLASLRPEYDHATQVMSVLGETGGPHAAVMNVFGFNATGLLLAALGASLVSQVPRTRLAILGGVLMGLFGAGVAAAGVFSCDTGCPREPTSLQGTLHLGVSVVAFLSGVTAPAVWAAVFRRLDDWRPLWVYSAGSAVVGFALLPLFHGAATSGVYKGVWQRLFLGTLFLWCSVVGTYAFRLTRERGGAGRASVPNR